MIQKDVWHTKTLFMQQFWMREYLQMFSDWLETGERTDEVYRESLSLPDLISGWVLEDGQLSRGLKSKYAEARELSIERGIVHGEMLRLIKLVAHAMTQTIDDFRSRVSTTEQIRRTVFENQQREAGIEPLMLNGWITIDEIQERCRRAARLNKLECGWLERGMFP